MSRKSKLHFLWMKEVMLLLLTLLFSIPFAVNGQVRVEYLGSEKMSDREIFSYRIVGASLSALNQMQERENENGTVHKFGGLTYDASTHICKVVLKAGKDYGEKEIRYFLSQSLGALNGSPESDLEEWADDDPRHQFVDHGPVSSPPPPTDPATMPDWSHLKPVELGSGNIGEEKR